MSEPIRVVYRLKVKNICSLGGIGRIFPWMDIESNCYQTLEAANESALWWAGRGYRVKIVRVKIVTDAFKPKERREELQRRIIQP